MADILDAQGVGRPPVPVEKIARNLGLEVLHAPLEGDLSGALFRSDSEKYIGVNSLHHLNRQRFTIAHEIGHFVLHKGMRIHVDKNFLVNWRDDESSQATSDEEMEANRFAAELLMPIQFLVKDIKELRGVGQETAALLAKKYKVSLKAMQIRLTGFGYMLPE